MRVAAREPTRRSVTGVIRIKAAPASNGTGPKALAGDRSANADADAAETVSEVQREPVVSG